MNRTLRAGLAALALSWAAPGHAVSARFEPLEAVTAKAGAAILSEVLRVEHRRDNPQWRVLLIQVKPLEAVFGEAPTQATLLCRYEEGTAHRRGAMAVAPLVSGSGMEFDVTPASRVILLLAHQPSAPEDCRVLRIEPLAHEALVRAARRAR